jgi:small subunit ribosomal protein S16
MVKIRLMRLGKKKQPYFRVVVADSRSPRDGRIIENIGKYHPRAHPSVIEIDDERAMHWLQNGAQPSDPVKVLLQKTGIWERFTGEAPPPPKPEKPPKKADAPAEAAKPPPEDAEPAQEAEAPEEAAERSETPEASSEEVAGEAEPSEEAEGPAEEAEPSETPEASSEEVVAQATEGSRASDEDDAEGDNAKEGDTA